MKPQTQSQSPVEQQLREENRKREVGCIGLLAGVASSGTVFLGVLIATHDLVLSVATSAVTAMVSTLVVAMALNWGLQRGAAWNKDLRNPKAWERLQREQDERENLRKGSDYDN